MYWSITRPVLVSALSVGLLPIISPPKKFCSSVAPPALQTAVTIAAFPPAAAWCRAVHPPLMAMLMSIPQGLLLLAGRLVRPGRGAELVVERLSATGHHRAQP